METKAMGGMGMMMDMKMMPQWFTTKTEMHFFLEDLKIDSIVGIASAMLFTILLVLIFEAVNFILNSKNIAFSRRKDKCTRIKKITSLILLTTFKMTSVLVGYLVMLCVMTFNIWLLVSVVIGSGVAHLVLRPLLLLCLTSGPPEMIVSDVEGAKKDLLHDFPADREGYNTFTERADGKAIQSLQQTETMPLIADITADRKT